jgi:ribosomal protein S4E
MNQIKSVQAKENWIVSYVLENDQIRQFDVKPYLKDEAFEKLSNIQEFNRIHNGRYFIEWDCGADLSLDTLNARSIIIKDGVLTN